MDAQKQRNLLLLFLGLSLLAHFSFLILAYYAKWESPYHAPEAVYVDLAATPPPATPLTQQEKAKQVVNSDVAPNTDTPKDAKYLGERSQSVAEETKSRTVDRFRKGGQVSQAGDGKKLSLKDLAPPSKALAPPTKLEMDGYKVQQQQKLAQSAESGKGGSIAPDDPGSASSDYLKDIKDGDKTMLSTKEFVYFGYYQRIRERLEVAWNTRLRSAVESYTFGGRQLANNRDYVTGVILIMDRNGHIKNVKLIQGSGARDLDQAAVDAFNAAGPFPDPPQGLVDENGEIKIPWNFVLQS